MAEIILNGKPYYTKEDLSKSQETQSTGINQEQQSFEKPSFAESHNPAFTLPIISIFMSVFMPLIGIIISFISLKRSKKIGNKTAIGASKFALILGIVLTIMQFLAIILIFFISSRTVKA
jgi:hypothetical protein